MSKKKYIIAIKNSEPAPPEFEYVCGPKAPIANFNAIVECSEVLLDTNIGSAEVFHSMENVVNAFTLLVEAGCDESLLVVFERKMVHSAVDTDELKIAVKERRVQKIINNIPTEDIEYLEDAGVLDLTKVT